MTTGSQQSWHSSLNILSVDFWRPFKKKKSTNIYTDNIIFWNSSKTIPSTSPTETAPIESSIPIYIYICNFGLVFNAETQLNVSIYTVEICKVAGTALTVHAVIHNDMHKTQHYPIGSKHTYIYTLNQQIEYSNRPMIPVIFTFWWNNSYVVS